VYTSAQPSKLPRTARADLTAAASITKMRRSGPGEVVDVLFAAGHTPRARCRLLHKRLVAQSFHSPLNRVAESSVYLTVLAMLRWPRYACSVLVSTPRLANA
jgi:hypothetical protein